MSTYLIPGVMGLLTGLMLHWGMFYRSDGLRSALGLRRSLPLRTGLTALGWGLLLTALLMWLAVIDVDGVEVLPLSFGCWQGASFSGSLLPCAALPRRQPLPGWEPATRRKSSARCWAALPARSCCPR